MQSGKQRVVAEVATPARRDDEVARFQFLEFRRIGKRDADKVRPPRLLRIVGRDRRRFTRDRSEEHTSELQSPCNLVCRLLLEKKKQCRLVSERALSWNLTNPPPHQESGHPSATKIQGPTA